MAKESKPFEFMGIRFESLPFNLPDGVLGMKKNAAGYRFVIQKVVSEIK
jgi:hypothetical protein